MLHCDTVRGAHRKTPSCNAYNTLTARSGVVLEFKHACTGSKPGATRRIPNQPSGSIKLKRRRAQLQQAENLLDKIWSGEAAVMYLDPGFTSTLYIYGITLRPNTIAMKMIQRSQHREPPSQEARPGISPLSFPLQIISSIVACALHAYKVHRSVCFWATWQKTSSSTKDRLTCKPSAEKHGPPL